MADESKNIRKIMETLEGKTELQENNDESIEELIDLQSELMEKVSEAERLVYQATNGDMRFERAKKYWINQMKSAIGSEEMMGGTMHSMQDTIDELGEEEDPWDLPDYQENPSPSSF